MNKIKTLSDLFIKHPYYCTDQNYYAPNEFISFSDWNDFYSQFGGADQDQNLVFRWDLKKKDSGEFFLEVFFILQRKGIFLPVRIDCIKEENINEIASYLMLCWENLADIWHPIPKNVVADRYSRIFEKYEATQLENTRLREGIAACAILLKESNLVLAIEQLEDLKNNLTDSGSNR